MGEESTSDDDETMGQPSGPTYVEEQEQFRRSFLQVNRMYTRSCITGSNAS
jgi:hypothetical protein